VLGGFEDGEAVFEGPLFGSLFILVEKCETVRGGFADGSDGSGANGIAVREVIRLGVEAFAVKETVLEGGSGGLLEVGVG